MGSFKIRTDLALEARENAEEEAESLSGVSVEEVYHEDSEVRITKVSITSKNSARALGKPMGTYITLEAPAMTSLLDTTPSPRDPKTCRKPASA